MDFDTKEIFTLYGTEKPKQLVVHDSSRGENDIRFIYVIKYPNKEKIVLKVSKNSFTTPERVSGWAQLCKHYNRLGIYCPNIIKNNNNEYCSEINGFLVYAEEYMKYKPLNDDGRRVEGEEKHAHELYESIGIVAANPAPLVPWNTAYCLFDKFDESDEFDESLDCAVKVRDFYCKEFPELAAYADDVFNEYCRRRDVFEPIYKSLPKAVFQGDINTSNILITKSGYFKGIIDFNLSGTETVLNYAFCESFECLNDDSEIVELLDQKALVKRDTITAKRLSWIGKYYRFTALEHKVWKDYYNIAAPFRWQYHCFFISLLSNHEKYPDGRKYAKDILDWIKYQLTRSDVTELLP